MKKRVLSALLALAMCLTLLPATALAEDCAHTNIDSTGYCPNCKTQMAVYVVNTEAYSTSLDAVLRSSNNFRLLADCDESVRSSIDQSITLDLNGHRLTALGMNGGASFLTVTDSVGTGSIGTLSLYHSAALSGGSYGTITSETSDLKNVLADGCAYQSTQSGEMLKYADLGVTTLTNVKVVKCTDHSCKDGTCEYCGALLYLNDKGVLTGLTTYTKVTSSTTKWSEGWYPPLMPR